MRDTGNRYPRRRSEAAASGPARLVWDGTCLPITPDSEIDPGLTYHLASRVEAYSVASRPKDMRSYDEAVVAITAKINATGRLRGNEVGASFASARQDLPAFIRNRRSVRLFSGESVAWSKVASVLAFGAGKRVDGPEVVSRRRLVPSPGGLFCIDTYLVGWGVAGLDGGVYFVDPDGECLRLVRRLPAAAELAAESIFTIAPENVKRAAGLLVLVFVCERLMWKYGPRSYRFACLEAGHVMHGYSIGAANQGLGLCALGGFCDAGLDDLVGVDGRNEVCVYAGIFGDPSADKPLRGVENGEVASHSDLGIESPSR